MPWTKPWTKPLRVLLVLLSLGLTVPASAQDPVLVEARSSLATYDVAEGGRTLRTLHDLGALAGRGDAEARYLRALASTEILAASLVLDDAALRRRLATAIDVPEADLRSHLSSELAASRGVYRSGAAGASELLTMVDELTTDPSRLSSHHGPHRDALFVLALAAAADRSALVADPCTARGGDVASCNWDEAARREVAALREGGLASSRAARARREGDPFLSLLAARLDSATARLGGFEVRPSIELPETMGVATAPAGGAPLRVDALVVVAEADVHVRAMPLVRVDGSGALVHVRGEGGGAEIDLPSDLPAVPQAVDALVAALSALGLPAGSSVGIAPTGAVPAHLVTRAILSIQRAGLNATSLVAAREDESLVAVPIAATRSAELTTVAARVRVQVGAYGFARGARGRESRIPRIRGEGGALVFDEAELSRRLDGGTFATVALEAMATVPSLELVRAAFLISRPARSVVFVLP